MAFVVGAVRGVWAEVSWEIRVAPLRHVLGWNDLTLEERADLLLAVDLASRCLAERGSEGFTAHFDDRPHQEEHFSLRVSARGAVVPGAAALIRGGRVDPLLPRLTDALDRASQAHIAVAFVRYSGLRRLEPHLRDLLARGGELRLLTGDYQDATEPNALQRLLDLMEPYAAPSGRAFARVFECDSQQGFHPKAWVLRGEGFQLAMVGSSNLTRAGLDGLNVEWSLATTEETSVRAAEAAFRELFDDSRTRPLTHAWIEAYRGRRRTVDSRATPHEPQTDIESAPTEDTPTPHALQQLALRALEDTRAAGNSAGLVVLATGLGKTLLAAFDSHRPEFLRVLFIAHRDEILQQALRSFRRVRPEANLGLYHADTKDPDAEVVFASVQTLARLSHLRRFARDAFDYIVVDEFHHAAAETYRRLLGWFTPRFLLGLTATPERSDGGDLLSLCGDNVVYRADIARGIEAGLLCPFTYHGVPDEVDYASIPWRSGRFDEGELTRHVATQARARNALEQHRNLGGRRTLAFCVSTRHADFMAEFFRKEGVAAVAVHSDARTSAPRSRALEDLSAGRLSVIFAVDLFNEGVDIPAVDTVLMLRPTESRVLWLQQFGRGLRVDPTDPAGKRLTVLDYIGNHRTFLLKAEALQQTFLTPIPTIEAMQLYRRGALDAELPPGCHVTYDLHVVDVLERLASASRKVSSLREWYERFRELHGARPVALEAFHEGMDPRSARPGFRSWFHLVAAMGDLDPVRASSLTQVEGLLLAVESGQPVTTAPWVVLQALSLLGVDPGGVSRGDLVREVASVLARHSGVRQALLREGASSPESVLHRGLDAMATWLRADGQPWVVSSPGRVELSPGVGGAVVGPVTEMLDELVAWRLGEVAAHKTSKTSVVAAPERALAPWRKYAREDIPPLFDETFNPGKWRSGVVPLTKGGTLLFVTLDKDGADERYTYADRFLDADHLVWVSQNQMRRDSPRSQAISEHAKRNQPVHLFLRPRKKRPNQTAEPFYYLGEVIFERWEGDAPITVWFRLPEAVPEVLRKQLRVPPTPPVR